MTSNAYTRDSSHRKLFFADVNNRQGRSEVSSVVGGGVMGCGRLLEWLIGRYVISATMGNI